MLDAKVELDGRLRTSINDFTSSFATKMTAALPAKLTAASSPETRSALGKTCEAIQKEVPELRRLLESYIDDTRTRETLVAAVQDHVIQLYDDFFEAYAAAEVGAGRIVKRSAGKGRADDVWDMDTFTDWTENVFRVGIPGLPDSEDHDDDLSSTRSV